MSGLSFISGMRLSFGKSLACCVNGLAANPQPQGYSGRFRTVKSWGAGQRNKKARPERIRTGLAADPLVYLGLPPLTGFSAGLGYTVRSAFVDDGM